MGHGWRIQLQGDQLRALLLLRLRLPRLPLLLLLGDLRV
jgi:hypothetical protein